MTTIKYDRRKDAYQILGVSVRATVDEIRAAFRKRSFDTHPDRGGSHDVFVLVEEAHRILVHHRREYDAARRVAHAEARQARANAPQSTTAAPRGSQKATRKGPNPFGPSVAEQLRERVRQDMAARREHARRNRVDFEASYARRVEGYAREFDTNPVSAVLKLALDTWLTSRLRDRPK